jgi:hypothetical protein
MTISAIDISVVQTADALGKRGKIRWEVRQDEGRRVFDLIPGRYRSVDSSLWLLLEDTRCQ